MNKRMMGATSTVLFLVILLTLGEKQVVASSQLTELVGIVEQKNRSLMAPSIQHEEPGNFPTRSDHATSIVFDGIKMFITQETIVRDIDGKKIDFNDVYIPSEAKIYYQSLPNGVQNILELDIQQPLSGASKSWQAPPPQ